MYGNRPPMHSGRPSDPRRCADSNSSSAPTGQNRQELNSRAASFNSSASINSSPSAAMQQIRPAPVPTHHAIPRLNAVNIQLYHRPFAPNTPPETVHRTIQPPPYHRLPAPVQQNNFPVIQSPPNVNGISDGAELAKLKQTIKDLEGQRQRQAASLAQCQNELREERANSKRQDASNKQEISRLRLKNLQLKNQTDTSSRSDDEINNLNAELARAKKEIEQLRRENQEQEKNQSDLFDDLERKREQAELDFEEEKAILQKENDSLRAKVVQIKEEFKSQERKHHGEARRLKEEKSTLKKEEDVKYDTREIERHNAEAQKAKVELQKTLRKYKDMLAILGKERKKCEMQQKKFARLKNNLKLEKIEGERMKEFLENRFQQISEKPRCDRCEPVSQTDGRPDRKRCRSRSRSRSCEPAINQEPAAKRPVVDTCKPDADVITLDSDDDDEDDNGGYDIARAIQQSLTCSKEQAEKRNRIENQSQPTENQKSNEQNSSRNSTEGNRISRESRVDKSAPRKVSAHRASSSLSDEERAEFIPQEAYPAATIRTLTHLTGTEINEMVKNPEIWIDDIVLFAFISSIAIRSPRRIIVVSPLYTACLFRTTTRDKDAPALEGAYRNFEEGPYDLAIIPVQSRAHWTIAIQEYGEAVRYYDPLCGASIRSKIQDRIVQAIEELSGLQPIRIQMVAASQYNNQTDLVSCGVHCMLIAESYIQHAETFLEKLDIDIERWRIIRQLRSLLDEDIPADYQERPLNGPLNG
ncbi:hypothetical protein Ddc_03638 [Ditylenchus destructor]|nr:hypothetical protein Ddc_03638 [Ditylenchus destructor]